MRYRRLGRTGLSVSELSYGAARGATKEPEQFAATVRAAVEAGINLIDTAAGYDDGDSERALGQVLAGNDTVLIETKYCPYESYMPDAAYTGSPEALVASVEASLRRLQRDHLDILLGHGIRSVETLDRFMTDGCYEAMVHLRDTGKVRYIGISELSEGDGTHQVLQKAVPTGAFDVVMLTINFLLQTAIDSVLPLCHRHDVGTVVMMPLNQASTLCGLVSVPAAQECVRRHIERGNLPNEAPYIQPDLFDFLELYSVPEAALRFVLAQEIGTCCVGTRRPERLAENLKAIDPPYLDNARIERLRSLFGSIQTQIR
ncbi:MAG: aldo/keto reductase family protein [Armatimonadaceae bacterium]